MIEALQNYLKSADWQEYVASFVKSNCEQFRVYSEEFTHEQYATWKNFQEIAEQVLEGALSEMHGIEFGGGMEALELELDRCVALVWGITITMLLRGATESLCM
jgi:hypothetical protein